MTHPANQPHGHFHQGEKHGKEFDWLEEKLQKGAIKAMKNGDMNRKHNAEWAQSVAGWGAKPKEGGARLFSKRIS